MKKREIRLSDMANRYYEYNGKVVFEGTPDDMLRQDNEYTKQFVMASLEGPMQMISEN